MKLLENLDLEQLHAMHQAGEEIAECYRVLQKADLNVVGEILKDQGTFYEWDHYPKGDVFDFDTHSQYYFHAHREIEGEHGHFHTFLRADGIPAEMAPEDNTSAEEWPKGDDLICHLIAISMDNRGYPTQLFTTNRWVTGEAWFGADKVLALAQKFDIDHAYPSWPSNRWLTAMLRLFRPQIALLVHKRDKTIETWQKEHAEVHVMEDRELEITSKLAISVERQMRDVKKALKKRT